ncbi:hypothetical protein MHYP_G00276310 [Metynnis hypsauchen]
MVGALRRLRGLRMPNGGAASFSLRSCLSSTENQVEEEAFAPRAERTVRVQDLNWQCVHGKLPVREVLYRHGLTRHPRCPRPACAKDESLRHVFWECGYARATWGKVDGLCRALDPQFALTYEKVMRGWSHDTRSPFLSRMWLLVSVTKRELWNARTSLIQKGTILDIVGIYRKICADLRFRMEHDVIRWGYHAAKERWRDFFEL